MPCEPGKHALCLPGSQGIFLHIHGRLEDLFFIPQAVRSLLPEGSERKGKSDWCKRRVSERMSQVARTGISFGKCMGLAGQGIKPIAQGAIDTLNVDGRRFADSFAQSRTDLDGEQFPM